MIIEVGIQSDEHFAEASNLNQTSIGLAFGVNRPDGTVFYGRIAAFHVRDRDVVVYLDGVSGDPDEVSLNLRHDEKLFFSRYTRESHLIGTLERIEDKINAAR
ncbi:hypothetical protein C3B61_03495 [Cryobacterium zongtaii]|uniref:Uncharacterized protein n=1 Tax=Cryobacterium zongtaii TaxID=1259217 RepID=A0A2S3ZKV2_9MICO|nr:hypothetical protein [Cryobacterium zongtaii]POH68977.1 hypothetical protein C3B61_03495 [Cryobacterium zongtaii]